MTKMCYICSVSKCSQQSTISMNFYIFIALALGDEIAVTFERESVSKLWLNGTLGCSGTQCNDLGFFQFFY